MTPLAWGLAAYVLAQLAIGLVVSRRIATEDDYLLAGRRLGPALATATLFATWFGAETCMGAAGEVYADGVALTSAEPFAYGLCLLLLGAVFARPLWRRGLTTLADLFRARYSPGVERLAAALMIPASVLWAAAQVRAFGQVLASVAELDLETATLVASSVAIAYTVAGGLLADAITDLVQGVALVVGLAALLAAVMAAAGGLGPALEGIEPARLRLAGAPGGSPLATLEAWAIPVCGSVVAQELVARISASRSADTARRSAFAAGGLYIAIGLLPVLAGLIGARLLPGLEDPEQVLPRLAQAHLPHWLAVDFAGALVSAILSTVDSTLLVASSLAAHNLVLPLRPRSSQRERVRTARLGVVAFGLLAYVLAREADGVLQLVEQASALGSAGLLVITVFGLFTRAGTAASAYASLVGGLAVYVGGVAAGWPYPYLASLAAALAGFALPALRSRRPLAGTRPRPA